MIRQAINCDMCGAERVETTSYWFVAEEMKGEIRLRGWDVSRKSHRNSRHLCGQKCVQRMMDNFTAAMLAGQQAVRVAVKESQPETIAAVAPVPGVAVVNHPIPVASDDHEDHEDHEDLPILQRMGYDRTTAEEIEAESWAGPVRVKESPTNKEAILPVEKVVPEKGFIRANHFKPLRAFQRMA